jgi:hypothetical protein
MSVTLTYWTSLGSTAFQMRLVDVYDQWHHKILKPTSMIHKLIALNWKQKYRLFIGLLSDRLTEADGAFVHFKYKPIRTTPWSTPTPTFRNTSHSYIELNMQAEW